jgi:GNAT superfamily N-acetyltransferase
MALPGRLALPSVTVTQAAIRAFEPADTAAAGRLLAARHAAHRRAEPLLSARFEQPDAATAEVEALLASGATGAVASDADGVTGFLLGVGKSREVWGDNVWVEAAGMAVSDAGTVGELYAAAAESWAAEGRDAHYVLVPAHDRALVDAWFRLCFGLQHEHAIREPAADAPPAWPARVRVRRAVRSDVPVLAELDVELPAHQARSPVFSAEPTPTLEEAAADWESSVDDEGFAHFVAEADGRVIGVAVGCALEKSSLHSGLARPERAGFLGFAAVAPQARGLGAGRALGEAVLHWCAVEGHTSAVTDWRSTNLLSSRAWPRLGFRPSFLRLHRRLGY